MTSYQGWTPPSEPVVHRSRWRLVARRGLGAVGLLIVTLALAGFALFLLVVAATFAHGDWVQRTMIGFGLAVAGGLALAVVGFSNGSARSIVRSRVSWVFAAICLGAIVWAVVGIDSTREVTALPEATLTYPGATEAGRWTAAASGSLDGSARATMDRKFTTADRYSAVQAYYSATLGERGWEGPSLWGSTGGTRFSDWRRGGFMIQLSFPRSDTESMDRTGPFTVRIYGPPQ
jgi:hypothetical protein